MVNILFLHNYVMLGFTNLFIHIFTLYVMSLNKEFMETSPKISVG